MILRHLMASTRYLVLLAVIGTLVGSVGLLVYELLVVGGAVADVIADSALSSKSAKAHAVGLIEAIDIFLIAIAAYITSLAFYSLFVDDTLPLPNWLAIHDLDDLKSNLLSVVIAVLAVVFSREAVVWDGHRDLFGFDVAVAIVIVIVGLTLFLAKKKAHRPPRPAEGGCARLDKAKAVTAAAHNLTRLRHSILTRGEESVARDRIYY